MVEPRKSLEPAPAQFAAMTDMKALLHRVGLRPTRQRMALAGLLMSRGNRHLTAEMLHEEAMQANVGVSLATIYNTLHQFTDAGLLRQVAVDGSKTYFDTNACDHHHFYIENDYEILDIPSTEISIGKMMAVPEGYEVTRIDLVVRLVRKPSNEKAPSKR